MECIWRQMLDAYLWLWLCGVSDTLEDAAGRIPPSIVERSVV